MFFEHVRKLYLSITRAPSGQVGSRDDLIEDLRPSFTVRQIPEMLGSAVARFDPSVPPQVHKGFPPPVSDTVALCFRANQSILHRGGARRTLQYLIIPFGLIQ